MITANDHEEAKKFVTNTSINSIEINVACLISRIREEATKAAADKAEEYLKTMCEKCGMISNLRSAILK